MIRVLAMISVAGFVLSVVCISVAVSLAGPDAVARGAWGWPIDQWSWRWNRGHDVSISGDLSGHFGPKASRELTWTGGDALTIQAPAEVSFTQSDGPARITVQGPQGTIDHLVVRDGRIEFDRPMFDAGDVKITMSAPNVTQFKIGGSGRLDISDYRQDQLTLSISGDGDVTAHGSAKTVQLTISGSGNADLGSLTTEGAQVTISGSGEAKVAPKTWAKLDISGSGDVDLLSHPAQLETHVSGSGRVDQEADDGGGDAEAAGDKT